MKQRRRSGRKQKLQAGWNWKIRWALTPCACWRISVCRGVALGQWGTLAGQLLGWMRSRSWGIEPAASRDVVEVEFQMLRSASGLFSKPRLRIPTRSGGIWAPPLAIGFERDLCEGEMKLGMKRRAKVDEKVFLFVNNHTLFVWS